MRACNCRSQMDKRFPFRHRAGEEGVGEDRSHGNVSGDGANRQGFQGFTLTALPTRGMNRPTYWTNEKKKEKLSDRQKSVCLKSTSEGAPKVASFAICRLDFFLRARMGRANGSDLSASTSPIGQGKKRGSHAFWQGHLFFPHLTLMGGMPCRHKRFRERSRRTHKIHDFLLIKKNIRLLRACYENTLVRRKKRHIAP